MGFYISSAEGGGPREGLHLVKNSFMSVHCCESFLMEAGQFFIRFLNTQPIRWPASWGQKGMPGGGDGRPGRGDGRAGKLASKSATLVAQVVNASVAVVWSSELSLNTTWR